MIFFFFFKCQTLLLLAFFLLHTRTRAHTHLSVPGLGLSPEQLECAGVFRLDPPGWHHQVSIRFRHHHQVGPLNDAPLDTLDRDLGIKGGCAVGNIALLNE